jgi:peptide/nickel transport system substrate-binding protein
MMTVAKGWDNGVPGPATSPNALAPTEQDNLIWPKWGQHFQTMHASGEAPDMQAAEQLLDLYKAWQKRSLADGTEISREDVWKRMLAIHAEQQFIIGVVSRAPQPVVVSNRLRNVPEDGLYTWDPGAQFGVHRMDEFWFADDAKTAALQ